MGLKTLLEKRAGIVADMKAMLDLAEEADRDLTAEEQQEYDEMKAAVESLNARITRAEEVAVTMQAAAPAAVAAGADIPPPPAPEAAREFESLGEFLVAVARNPGDQRLASLYQERQERQAAQRMDDGPSGGYAVPTQFIETILRVPGQAGEFRNRSQVIPAGDPPDSSVTIPALDQANGTTGNTVRGGVAVTWIGEAQAKPATDTKLKLITLEPKEVAASLKVTDKLLRNWRAAAPFLEGLMRDAVRAAEEDAFLNGNGVAKPLGIINAPAAITVSRSASGPTYADLVNMVSKLKMGAGVWFISQSEMPAIMKIQDPQGNYIWQPNARDGMPTVLLGFPVVWYEFSPLVGLKGSVVLANLSEYLIKDGSGPFVAASEHVYFETNQTVFKVFFNVDGQPWQAAPHKQEKGYQVSPFVILGAA